MLRVPLDMAHHKRSIRVLYGWNQTTPKHVFLDPAWDRSVDIHPGMCMVRTSGDNVTLIGATGGHPYGLSGLYVAPDLGIDEVRDQGVNAFAVWVLNIDAEFEVDAPAFDPDATWTDPGDGTNVLVHAWATGVDRGKLAPAGASKSDHTLSTRPCARLLKVNSDMTITIGGLVGTTG